MKKYDYEINVIEAPIVVKGVPFSAEIVRVQGTEMEPPGSHVFYFQSYFEAQECLAALTA